MPSTTSIVIQYYKYSLYGTVNILRKWFLILDDAYFSWISGKKNAQNNFVKDFSLNPWSFFNYYSLVSKKYITWNENFDVLIIVPPCFISFNEEMHGFLCLLKYNAYVFSLILHANRLFLFDMIMKNMIREICEI